MLILQTLVENNSLYLQPRCQSMVNWSLDENTAVVTRRRPSRRRRITGRVKAKHSNSARVQKIVNGQLVSFRVRRVVKA